METVSRLTLGVLVLASFAACDAPPSVAGLSGPALQRAPAANSIRGTLGYDLEFAMRPEEAALRAAEIPGGAEMAEIVRVGARAIRWADTLQSAVPPEQREQLWRRIDHVGHEPSAEHPLVYAPAIISTQLRDALAAAPAGVENVLRGSGDLPAAPPEGSTVHDVIGTLRAVSLPYSRAGRWIGLYPVHAELAQGARDLRPWLKLSAPQSAFADEAARWATLGPDTRKAWIHGVAAACPLGGADAASCESAHAALASQDDPSGAQAWLKQELDSGQRVYDSHFGVQVSHPGIKVAASTDGGIEVSFFTIGIPDTMLAWIQGRVDAAWKFAAAASAPSTTLKLAPVADEVPGVMHVVWQEGVLPHVNAVGGDTITMDANTPQWLEQTQVTMSHEFGHVIGFPDCYVEFWDDSAQAFVEYPLDADDRMCALSGGSMERHRQAMLVAWTAHAE